MPKGLELAKDDLDHRRSKIDIDDEAVGTFLQQHLPSYASPGQNYQLACNLELWKADGTFSLVLFGDSWPHRQNLKPFLLEDGKAQTEESDAEGSGSKDEKTEEEASKNEGETKTTPVKPYFYGIQKAPLEQLADLPLLNEEIHHRLLLVKVFSDSEDLMQKPEVEKLLKKGHIVHVLHKRAQ